MHVIIRLWKLIMSDTKSGPQCQLGTVNDSDVSV